MWYCFYIALISLFLNMSNCFYINFFLTVFTSLSCSCLCGEVRPKPKQLGSVFSPQSESSAPPSVALSACRTFALSTLFFSFGP